MGVGSAHAPILMIGGMSECESIASCAMRFSLTASRFRVFPEAGVVVAGSRKSHAEAGDIDHVELLVALLDAVAVIEQRFGPVDVPERFTRGGFEEVLKAAAVLTADGGTASFEELVIELGGQPSSTFSAERAHAV